MNVGSLLQHVELVQLRGAFFFQKEKKGEVGVLHFHVKKSFPGGGRTVRHAAVWGKLMLL